jgi:hypothetical protein
MSRVRKPSRTWPWFANEFRRNLGRGALHAGEVCPLAAIECSADIPRSRSLEPVSLLKRVIDHAITNLCGRYQGRRPASGAPDCYPNLRPIPAVHAPR